MGFSVGVERITGRGRRHQPGAARCRAARAAPGAGPRHRRHLSVPRRAAPGSAADHGPQGGLTPEQQDAVRGLALGADALPRRRLHPRPAATRPRCSASWSSPSAGSTWTSTCRCSRRSSPSRRGPAGAGLAQGRHRTGHRLQVVVIGAGMSGLLTAHRLQQAGVRLRRPREERRRRRHLVREQLPGLPGRQPQPHLQLLLRPEARLAAALLDAGRVARQYFRDVRRRLRPAPAHPLRHRGRVGDLRRDSSSWSVEVRTAEGADDVDRANMVISAVGQLNRPNSPTSPAATCSPARRSTRRGGTTTSTSAASGWPSSAPAPSAVQFVPAIADDVAELHVFQRTPPWMGPTPEYHDEVPRFAVAVPAVPLYSEWNRFWIFWRMADGVLAASGSTRSGSHACR